MAKTSHPLTDKDLVNINKRLKELEAIKEQILLARKANVPEIDELEQRCEECIKDAVNLKATYFPTRR